MASLGKRGGRRFQSFLRRGYYFNDDGDSLYNSKSDNFDEWCKLNKKRLIKLFSDDYNLTKETNKESITEKAQKIAEIRFPQFLGVYSERDDCVMRSIESVFDFASNNSLVDFNITQNIHTYTLNILIQLNWVTNLYKSTDVIYLNSVINAIKEEMNCEDMIEHPYWKTLQLLQSDLTTIIAKVELEQALPNKTKPKKTNKI